MLDVSWWGLALAHSQVLDDVRAFEQSLYERFDLPEVNNLTRLLTAVTWVDDAARFPIDGAGALMCMVVATPSEPVVNGQSQYFT